MISSMANTISYVAMSSLTVRNFPDAIHRAFKLRAAHHGRSTEAEVRLILEAAVAPRTCLGSALAAIGRNVGGAGMELKRDRRPVKPASLT